MALAVLETRHEVVTEMRARLTLGTLEPVAREIAWALLAHGVIDAAGRERGRVT